MLTVWMPHKPWLRTLLFFASLLLRIDILEDYRQAPEARSNHFRKGWREVAETAAAEHRQAKENVQVQAE